MINEQRRRDYETMIVLRADLQEAGVKEQIERFTKLLEAQGAELRGVHEWGLRELAYPIHKERRGFYSLVEYTGTAVAVLELERQMKLSDVVLRYVSVRQQWPVPTSDVAPDAAEPSSSEQPIDEAPGGAEA